MSNIDKSAILKEIIEAAKLYNENLIDKNMLTIYEQAPNKHGHFEALFEARHFLHLTGVEPNSVLSVDFYSRCVNKKLSVQDFEINDVSNVLRKMKVILHLMSVHKFSKMTGYFNGKSVFSNLYTERLVGGIRACMGFLKEESGYFVPNTILEEDIRNVINEKKRILAIYIKDKTAERYSHLCYLAKPLKPESLRWSTEINTKIDNDNLVIGFRNTPVHKNL